MCCMRKDVPSVEATAACGKELVPPYELTRKEVVLNFLYFVPMITADFKKRK